VVIPPGGAPAPKKTNWLLIGGIGAAVIAICVCAACVLSPFVLALAGPSLMQPLAATNCGIMYPSLSADECSEWASDMVNNHLSELNACTSAANSNANALFDCLEEQGLAPDQ
jgi:hypothetical protein